MQHSTSRSISPLYMVYFLIFRAVRNHLDQWHKPFQILLHRMKICKHRLNKVKIPSSRVHNIHLCNHQGLLLQQYMLLTTGRVNTYEESRVNSTWKVMRLFIKQVQALVFMMSLENQSFFDTSTSMDSEET